MKKIVAIAVSMVVFSTCLFAADITVGGRGSLGLGLGTYVYNSDLDLGKSIDLGFSGFVNIPVEDKIGIQPELGFSMNKFGLKYSGFKVVVKYNTIDLPILVSYTAYQEDLLKINALFGPKFSYVIGKAKYSGDFSGDSKVNSFLFSAVIGADAIYAMGNGSLVGGLRYDFGFNVLKDKDSDSEHGIPRALSLSVGYQVKLQ